MDSLAGFVGKEIARTSTFFIIFSTMLVFISWMCFLSSEKIHNSIVRPSEAASSSNSAEETTMCDRHQHCARFHSLIWLWFTLFILHPWKAVAFSEQALAFQAFAHCVPRSQGAAVTTQLKYTFSQEAWCSLGSRRHFLPSPATVVIIDHEHQFLPPDHKSVTHLFLSKALNELFLPFYSCTSWIYSRGYFKHERTMCMIC